MHAVRVDRQPAFTCHPADSIQAWSHYPPAADAEDAPLGLVMIVKDEVQSINVTLASARPHIDYWTMVDTGSTDGTQAMVQEAMQGVPGGVCFTRSQGNVTGRLGWVPSTGQQVISG